MAVNDLDHDDSLITLEIRWRASQGFRGSCTVGAWLLLMVILVSAEVLCNSHMLCTEFPNHERWGVFKFHTPRLSCWGFYLKPHPKQFKVIDFYRSCHNKIKKNIQQLCMWIFLWRLSLNSHFHACNSMCFIHWDIPSKLSHFYALDVKSFTFSNFPGDMQYLYVMGNTGSECVWKFQSLPSLALSLTHIHTNTHLCNARILNSYQHRCRRTILTSGKFTI